MNYEIIIHLIFCIAGLSVGWWVGELIGKNKTKRAYEKVVSRLCESSFKPYLPEEKQNENSELVWLPVGVDIDRRYCLFLIKDGVKIKIKDPKYKED